MEVLTASPRAPKRRLEDVLEGTEEGDIENQLDAGLMNMMDWLGPRFAIYGPQEDTGVTDTATTETTNMGESPLDLDSQLADMATAPTEEEWELILEKPVDYEMSEFDNEDLKEPDWGNWGKKYACYFLYFLLDKCLTYLWFFIPIVNIAAVFDFGISFMRDSGIDH